MNAPKGVKAMTIKYRSTGYLNKARGKLVLIGTKFAAALHVHMCETLLHAQKHGDVSLCQAIFDDLGGDKSPHRTASIKVWFGKMGPITAKAGVWKLKENWKPEQFKIAEAEKTPLVDAVGGERKPIDFTLAGWIASLASAPKRVDSALEEHRFKGDPTATKQAMAEIIDFSKATLAKRTPQESGLVATPANTDEVVVPPLAPAAVG